MARVLILSLDGQEFPVEIVKIDRDKLYGNVEIEAFDENGNQASLKILAADGKTLIDKGGTALATVTESGDSIERSELVARRLDGEVIEQVPSSFNAPNVLNLASIDDYLSNVVKTIYLLKGSDGRDYSFLYDDLFAGNIYGFPFSYRGGNEYDNAFVIGADESAFIVTGNPATFEFVKLNQSAVLDAAEEDEISADDLDFDLL